LQPYSQMKNIQQMKQENKEDQARQQSEEDYNSLFNIEDSVLFE